MMDQYMIEEFLGRHLSFGNDGDPSKVVCGKVVDVSGDYNFELDITFINHEKWQISSDSTEANIVGVGDKAWFQIGDYFLNREFNSFVENINLLIFL